MLLRKAVTSDFKPEVTNLRLDKQAVQSVSWQSVNWHICILSSYWLIHAAASSMLLNKQLCTLRNPPTQTANINGSAEYATGPTGALNRPVEIARRPPAPQDSSARMKAKMQCNFLIVFMQFAIYR